MSRIYDDRTLKLYIREIMDEKDYIDNLHNLLFREKYVSENNFNKYMSSINLRTFNIILNIKSSVLDILSNNENIKSSLQNISNCQLNSFKNDCSGIVSKSKLEITNKSQEYITEFNNKLTNHLSHVNNTIESHSITQTQIDILTKNLEKKYEKKIIAIEEKHNDTEIKFLLFTGVMSFCLAGIKYYNKIIIYLQM